MKKLLEEVAIRYLIGIFIAALMGFLFWWLVIHNESDRITERSFYSFYSSLDKACLRRASENNPERVYIKIPQRTYGNPIETGIRFIKEKLGIEPSLKYFDDPYYKIYWEKFPPEAPYSLTDVISRGSPLGSFLAFYFPWSEDLPWSSNLVSTILFSTFIIGLDLDFLASKELAKYTSKGHNFLKNLLRRKGDELMKMVGKNFPELAKAIHTGSEFVFSAKDFIIKVAGLTMTIIGRGTKEIKFVSKIGLFYTSVCLMATEKTLGHCLVEGMEIGVIADTFKFFSHIYLIPKVKEHLKLHVAILCGRISDGLSDFMSYISNKIDGIKSIFYGLDDSNLDEFNKLLDECKESMTKAKKLLNDGNDVEALRYLKNTEEKLFEASKKLKNININEEFSLFVFFARVDLELLAEEISSVLEKTNAQLPGTRPFIELGSLLESLSEIGDDSIMKPTKKILREKNFKYDVDGKLALTQDDNPELFKNFKDVLEAFEAFEGKKLREYNGFKFLYDENGNLIKIIYDVLDENSFQTKMKKFVFGYPKKYLGILLEKGFIHNKAIDGKHVAKLLDELKEELIRNENKRYKLLKRFEEIGRKTSEQELFNYLDETIKKWKSGEYLVLVIEKESKLAELADDLTKIREYLYNVIEEGDKIEILNLYGLITGKSLKLKENLEIFFNRGVIGFAALTAIDLYSPIGISAWDKYISYYGYEGQELPYGCQTICEEGKICLHLGACVRNFDLPKSCKELGITEVKLKRDSIIASDPRFYLVSPCYANLEIFIDREDATIYIKPHIDKEKLKNTPNYCYANENFLHFYLTSYMAQYIIRCAASFICGGGTTLLSGGTLAADAIVSIISACLFGVGVGLCGLISDLIDFGTITVKEATLVWPTVYQKIPYLI